MARLLAAATLAATAGAFVTTAPVTTPVSVRAENSEAFPFLARPEKLDGSMIGDVGFDPLGFTEILPIVRALTCLCQHQSCIPPRILWPRLSRRSS